MRKEKKRARAERDAHKKTLHRTEVSVPQNLNRQSKATTSKEKRAKEAGVDRDRKTRKRYDIHNSRTTTKVATTAGKCAARGPTSTITNQQRRAHHQTCKRRRNKSKTWSHTHTQSWRERGGRKRAKRPRGEEIAQVEGKHARQTRR